ncbi:ArsR family transcriptional regulator [Candidatus Alkanophaga liquidiphilum]|nr:hypothetical protein [Candidatus Alkanophaga liquidiphilum]
MDTEELLRDAHVLLHPIRYKIIELLMNDSLHISEISNRIQEDRRLVSYHLLTLEECGFLESAYEISYEPKSKGKALRKYKVTDKVGKVISELKNRISEIPNFSSS